MTYDKYEKMIVELEGLICEKPQQLKDMVQQLKSYNEISEAYLVRKVIDEEAEIFIFVLGVKRNVPLKRFWAITSDNTQLCNHLAENLIFPGPGSVIILNGVNKSFEKIMKKINNVKIYTAPQQ